MAGRWTAGIGRWKKQMLSIGGAFLLFGIAMYQEYTDSSLSQGYLERGGYGEDSRRYDLIVDGAFGEPVTCTVDIGPVQYEEVMACNLMEELFGQLPERILGANGSLDQVRTDLNLVTSFDGTGIRAVWQSRDPEVVDSYGQITAEDIGPEGIQAVLAVTLTDGVYEKEGELTLRVCPAVHSEKEEKEEALRELIQMSDWEQPFQEQVILPKEYQGKKLRYRDAGASDYWILPVLGVALAVLFYGQEKTKEENKKKQRRQMLLLDYADVVYQLMVYIGAGLTVQKAWECITQGYEARKERHGGPVRPAYEEMAITLRQIQYGEPEGKAIDAFGRRCNLQPYMKLSSLLEQNRRTGTKNLQQLLEQEMTAAWEEQKHTARRLGEEAGTRLLIPLFLMLAVVMVIIMVPALLAVQ